MIFFTPQQVRTIALFIALVVWMTACVTPEAVRQFTAASKDASDHFPPLVRDLTASCIRKQLADRPPAEIDDVSAEVKTKCKELSELEPQILGALSVLTNYLNALNQLASDQVVSYDKQIDEFATKVQAVAKFGDAPVKAVRGLAKFLLDAAASGYQRRKLGSAIKAADEDVTTLTDRLGIIISEDYGNVLQNEENSLRERYRTAIQSDTTKNLTTDLLIQDRWRQDLDTLGKKRLAAHDCKDILGKIRDGHHQLARQVDHWTAKELYQTLSPYTASIKSLLADFQSAF